MAWPPLDLVLLTGSTYGLSWVLTRSKLMRRAREILSAVPGAAGLVRCIVCVGPWVGAGLVLVVVPRSHLFSESFRVRTAFDLLVVIGWLLFSNWLLARLLHDAE